MDPKRGDRHVAYCPRWPFVYHLMQVRCFLWVPFFTYWGCVGVTNSLAVALAFARREI